MFEKLITDLKKSLPESLRKKMGGAEDPDDDTQLDVTGEESDDTELDEAEEKKKKMKSMIIKVIVILGLGYFALDEFVLKGMQGPTEAEIFAQADAKRKRPKPPKKEEPAAATESTAAIETTDAVPPADTVTAASATETTETTETPVTPPIENINVMDKSEPEVASTVQSEVEQAPATQVETPVVSQTTMGESNVDQNLDQLVENVEQTMPSSPVEEINIPSKSESATPAPSMASKIVEGITETPPPAYDQLGRGLVYNCKDKYWACLDKPAYVTCNKNMKWNKSKGNSAECVVADVYSSEEDCAKVQKYNVSTSASTAFCQN